MATQTVKLTEKIAEDMCEIISTSDRGLKSIAKEFNISHSLILKWIRDNESFRDKYARAKQDQADLLAEQILEISDDSSKDLKGIDEYGNRIEDKEFVNRSRLRIDARKWIASKLAPKKYGEKLDLNHSGELEVKEVTFVK